MAGLTPGTNAAVMAALLARLDTGGAALCLVFSSVQPATGAAAGGSPVCAMTLANPCGTIDPVTGALVLVATDNGGTNGQITNAATPKWVRFYNNAGDIVMDLSARLASADNLGEEVVLTLTAPATSINVGAFIRIASGTVSA